MEYQCEGFLEKNKDTVNEEQINVLKNSKVKLFINGLLYFHFLVLPLSLLWLKESSVNTSLTKRKWLQTTFCVASAWTHTLELFNHNYWRKYTHFFQFQIENTATCCLMIILCFVTLISKKNNLSSLICCWSCLKMMRRRQVQLTSVPVSLEELVRLREIVRRLLDCRWEEHDISCWWNLAISHSYNSHCHETFGKTLFKNNYVEKYRFF